jgi:hypothetical protein
MKQDTHKEKRRSEGQYLGGNLGAGAIEEAHAEQKCSVVAACSARRQRGSFREAWARKGAVEERRKEEAGGL